MYYDTHGIQGYSEVFLGITFDDLPTVSESALPRAAHRFDLHDSASIGHRKPFTGLNLRHVFQ